MLYQELLFRLRICYYIIMYRGAYTVQYYYYYCYTLPRSRDQSFNLSHTGEIYYTFWLRFRIANRRGQHQRWEVLTNTYIRAPRDPFLYGFHSTDVAHSFLTLQNPRQTVFDSWHTRDRVRTYKSAPSHCNTFELSSPRVSTFWWDYIIICLINDARNN